MKRLIWIFEMSTCQAMPTAMTFIASNLSIGGDEKLGAGLSLSKDE